MAWPCSLSTYLQRISHGLQILPDDAVVDPGGEVSRVGIFELEFLRVCLENEEFEVWKFESFEFESERKFGG